MKLHYFITVFVYLSFVSPINSQNLEKQIIEAIEKTATFDALKEKRIQNLKLKLVQLPEKNNLRRYQVNLELFNEYRIFKQDSAFQYALRLRQLAKDLDSIPLIATAAFNLSDISVSAGMYKEALEFMETIEVEKLPENMRSLYYGLYGRLYNEMAEYSNLPYFSSRYLKQAREYRKSALGYTEKGTFFNLFLQSFFEYKHGSLKNALSNFEDLLKLNLGFRDLALVHYFIGDIHSQLNNKEEAITHFSKASIADIKNSTKENLAMIRLAELYFESGKIKTASILIRKANDDAAFYGAQQRKLRVAAILPIIEKQLVAQIEKQKQKLYRQNIIVSLLLFFVIGFAVVILIQVLRMKRAKKIIEKAHDELKSTNQRIVQVNDQINSKNKQLNQLNDKLLEANKIKEEYIGFFFTQDAGIFEKFREFKSKIERDLKDEDINKLNYTVNNLNLKREKEKLLVNFDEAFINLFPNFIEEFNSLLKQDEQIILKKGQLLNKELRIFALIRLGIHHNEIVAQILGYSVNSIYAYKTKIRKKSKLNKKEFDRKLIENTTLRL